METQQYWLYSCFLGIGPPKMALVFRLVSLQIHKKGVEPQQKHQPPKFAKAEPGSQSWNTISCVASLNMPPHAHFPSIWLQSLPFGRKIYSLDKKEGPMGNEIPIFNRGSEFELACASRVESSPDCLWTPLILQDLRSLVACR